MMSTNMGGSLFAHTPAKGSDRWHDLRDHLFAVSAQAREFGDAFGAGDICAAIGLAHDLAKADPRFQAYLIVCFEGRHAEKCPHAAPSALATKEILGPFQMAVLGHHTGLPDKGEVAAKFEQTDHESAKYAQDLLATLGPLPDMKRALPHWATDKLACEMFVRMCFSCLVDADFLDTEAHFSGQRPQPRGNYPALSDYLGKLDHELAQTREQSAVNEARAEILAACRSSAPNPPGAFRLTVPTGGGKTLSGLAFALGHSLHNQQRRIILAIPYTSIIDQTAAVYKGIFGERDVLEHHSALNIDEDDSRQSQTELERRLAAENWDCPLIVTTTVQLFESLLHNRTSRCRKLHNIAGSVIILDEVQALPPHTLGPILDVLGELVEHYGCSVVFCTATQPDYSGVDNRLLKDACEIVPEYPKYFDILKRVAYRIEEEPWTAERVADEVRERQQVMAVFNTRKDALRVAREVGKESELLHLSTLLCGHHRKRIVQQVKADLEADKEVRLISTQVVEAGVDVDFPVVMRDLGPMDRIIQVAGRCNREGKLKEKGECIVFRLESGGAPRGPYRTAIEITEPLLTEFGENLDSPDAMRAYSRGLFRLTETGSLEGYSDKATIQKLRGDWAYRTVAETFRLIDQNTVPLIVEGYPFVEVDELISGWEYRPLGWFRRLSPFTVNVYQHELATMQRERLVRPHDSGAWIYSGHYDKTFGLAPDLSDPADLIA